MNIPLTSNSRRLGRRGTLKPVDDTPPLDLRFLEIHKKTEGQAGSSQIIKTLCGVFIDKLCGTLQLHHQYALDEQVGKVFSHAVALVSNGKRGFCGSANAT